MLGQKEAVIVEVLGQLPNFQKFIDNAATMLSTQQLEAVKQSIYTGITAGNIDYSKDRTNLAEVRAYARSMVMNHLKKAKELNGGNSYTPNTASGGSTTVRETRPKEKVAPKGVNVDLLPEELKEYVKTLV